MNNKKNPFDKSLRPVLMTIDAATIGTRLMQAVMNAFAATQSEAEVLIEVASYRKPVAFGVLCEDLTHLTRDTVKRALLALTKSGYVLTDSVIDHDDLIYHVSPGALQTMKAFTRDTLEHWGPTNYNEAIVKAAPPPLFPVYPETLERAMSFCYGLLAPGQNASQIISLNAQRAAEAHRAFYERKPHDVPYDEMMASMPKPMPKPEPVPAPVKHVTLIEALINAFKMWRNQTV